MATGLLNACDNLESKRCEKYTEVSLSLGFGYSLYNINNTVAADSQAPAGIYRT